MNILPIIFAPLFIEVFSTLVKMSKFTAGCKEQKRLLELIATGKVTRETSPQVLKTLDSASFDKFSQTQLKNQIKTFTPGKTNSTLLNTSH